MKHTIEISVSTNNGWLNIEQVLAERDQLAAKVESQALEIKRLNEEEHKSQLHLERACRSRDQLAAKVESQAREIERERKGQEQLSAIIEARDVEIERLQTQCNERGRLAIDNGIRMERAEAKVAEMEKQEPIGEMRENGVVWFGKNPHAFPVGTRYFVAPGAAPKVSSYVTQEKFDNAFPQTALAAPKGAARNEPQLFGGKLNKAFNETL